MNKHVTSALALTWFCVLAAGSGETTPSTISASSTADVTSAVSASPSGGREGVAESTPTRSEGDRAAEVKSLAKCKLSLASAKRVVKRHPDWDDDILSAVACGRVAIGMTTAQARAGWGAPDDINRSTYSFGVHEQWVYGEYGERGYLYFEDGILTSIQN